MKPDELQRLYNKARDDALAEKKISPAEIERISTNLGEQFPQIVHGIAEYVHQALSKKASSMLSERKVWLEGFEKRHYRLWKRGLDLLETYLVVAYELGDNFNKHYRKGAANDQDYLFDALTRLHARAVHIGFEVLALLSSGFADGAHARGRTAHEIAVVANFLLLRGKETAERYLAHEAIESYRAMDEFQKHAEALGHEPFPDDEVSQLKTRKEELCDRYGKEYASQYGWAANTLNSKRPTFSDIEKASEMAHFRPYYRMASHNVHANPKGICYNLGLPHRKALLLAGPSNYGLAEPAHGVAISVRQATVPMLSTRVNIDSLVMSTIMGSYVDDIEKAFVEVDQTMEEKEKD